MKAGRSMRGRLALTTVLALVIVPAGLARAATITVNTSGDELKPGDGLCSLREAISAVDGIGGGDCGAAGIVSNTIMLGAGHYAL
jgi:CSLREA domain-containing protein